MIVIGKIYNHLKSSYLLIFVSFIISSDKNSQLKIKEVSFTTSARLSFTENSTYTCETCFDEINILTGYILRRVCLNSTSRVQAIGKTKVFNDTIRICFI